jgi:hypothetical protein
MKDLELDNPIFYNQLITARKILQRLDHEGIIKPFVVRFPTLIHDDGSITTPEGVTIPPPNNHNSACEGASRAPEAPSEPKPIVFSCEVCQKEYSSRRERDSHKRKRHAAFTETTEGPSQEEGREGA